MHRHTETGIQSNQKTKDKMAVLSLHFSTFNLNVDGSNLPSKRHRAAGGLKNKIK